MTKEEYHIKRFSLRCVRCSCVFFFFKQKTAYEIGTGDWSSDVCSSDLTSTDIPDQNHVTDTVGISTSKLCQKHFASGLPGEGMVFTKILIVI